MQAPKTLPVTCLSKCNLSLFEVDHIPTEGFLRRTWRSEAFDIRMYNPTRLVRHEFLPKLLVLPGHHGSTAAFTAIKLPYTSRA